MIIFRYLAKQLGLTLIALTSILVLIFMSNQVVIYLNRAANGVIPGVLVLQLMVLELPNLLALLLPLGFYFALLLAYGRLYAESEMIVLQACGYGPQTLLKHSLLIALGVAALTAWLISMNPSIAYQRARLLQTTGIQTLIQTIVPGSFRDVLNGQYVFYVEEMNHQHSAAKHIFIAKAVSSPQGRSWDILTAEKASMLQDKASGEVYLTLLHAQHYQAKPGQANAQVAEIGRYEARLPHADVTVKNDIRTLPFKALLPVNNPDKHKAAELQWRLSIPLMVISLCIVGVPLSRINPRAGRYAKLLPAMLLAVLYANFMFVTRDWIATGKLPVFLGMACLHLLVIALGMGLLWRQGVMHK